MSLLAYSPLLHLVELTRAGAVAHYEPMQYTSWQYVVGMFMVSLCAGLALYRLRVLARVTV